MFGTFLLFLIYIITTLGIIVGLGSAIFFMLKAKEELSQPKEFIDIIKEPTIFLSENGFSEDGNQSRQRCLLSLSVTVGLIILSLLMKLALS